MKITRKNLILIIDSIISEQFTIFTIPTGTKNSSFPYYSGGKSSGLNEIEASEVGDDARADMGGAEPGDEDTLWDEDGGFLNEKETSKKKEKSAK